MQLAGKEEPDEDGSTWPPYVKWQVLVHCRPNGLRHADKKE